MPTLPDIPVALGVTTRLVALCDAMGGVDTDHPGVAHLFCRQLGRQTVAYTRCCNKPIDLPGSSWACEVEPLVPTDCCDRPWPTRGEWR